MKEEKNIMNAAELNEEELEKVGGGSKKLNPGKKLTLGQSVTPSKLVIIGDGPQRVAHRLFLSVGRAEQREAPRGGVGAYHQVTLGAIGERPLERLECHARVSGFHDVFGCRE